MKRLNLLKGMRHGILLALGYVLRKKVKIKEEERGSTKCAEDTQTKEGSKWLNKYKRMNEVKEKKVVEREDQGRQCDKEDRSWTSQQLEEDTKECVGAPREKEGRMEWRSH
jgi:hypothetical protein